MFKNPRSGEFPSVWLWTVCALLVLLHLALIIKYLGHPVEYDELYHILSANSWLESGRFAILDGEYTRSWLYTILIALWSELVSGSLEGMRVSSALFSILLLITAVFYIARRVNPGAAIVAGALLALSPPIVGIAFTIRFYSLQVFTVFLVSILVYDLLTCKRSVLSFALLSLVALILLGFSLHLQITTLVAVLGIALGAVIISAPDLWRLYTRLPGGMRVVTVTGLIILVAIALYLVDPVQQYQTLRHGPLWSSGLADNLLFYHHWMKAWYPALWSLMPFFLLVGLVKYPRAMLYFATIFVVGFAIFSLGATKAQRFIALVMPYWCVAMGLGVAATLAAFYRLLATAFAGPGMPVVLRSRSGLAGGLLVALALLSYLSFQPLVRGAQRVVMKPGYEGIYGNPSRWYDWAAAAPYLRELHQSHPIVVSSTGVKAIHFLGDLTVDMNKSVMLETVSRDEFGLDTRTGRPVISAPESMRKLIETCGPGMAVIEAHHANSAVAVPTETIAVLDTMGTRLPNPVDGLMLWTWSSPNADGADSTGACLETLGFSRARPE